MITLEELKEAIETKLKPLNLAVKNLETDI